MVSSSTVSGATHEDRLVLTDQPTSPQSRLVRQRSGVGRENPTDGLLAVWRAKWIIAGVALVMGAFTYGVSTVLPATWESASLVQVTAINNGVTSQADTVTASNNLAAQYAQYADSTVVAAGAAKSLPGSLDAATLATRTSAATVANQNLIRVTVQAEDPGAARAEAKAVAVALNDYVSQQGDAAVKTFTSTIQSQLDGLDEQINGTRQQITALQISAARSGGSDGTITTLSGQQSLLTELVIRRATLSSQAASTEVSLRPTSGVVGDASGAAKVQPRPQLYTVVAFLVGLLISAQVAVILARRRISPSL